MIGPALIIAGAIAAAIVVLALATWAVGRAEDRHEQRAAGMWDDEDAPPPEPPPRHAARTLGRAPSSRLPWT